MIDAGWDIPGQAESSTGPAANLRVLSEQVLGARQDAPARLRSGTNTLVHSKQPCVTPAHHLQPLERQL